MSRLIPTQVGVKAARPDDLHDGIDSPVRVDVADLYCRYAPMVRRRVQRFVRADEVDEVLHDVFVRVVERLDSFRGSSSPATWLYALTTNHCLNRIRNTARRRELWAEFGGLHTSTGTSEADPETRLFLRELCDDLDAELLLVGVYYFVDGMSHAEIARILACSRRTVGNRVAQLQARLRIVADGPPSKGGTR